MSRCVVSPEVLGNFPRGVSGSVSIISGTSGLVTLGNSRLRDSLAAANVQVFAKAPTAQGGIGIVGCHGGRWNW